MQTAFERIVQEQGLFGSIFEDEWIDLGYPWNVLDANHFLMKSYQQATIASTVKFEGNVTINGPVQIEDDVVIGRRLDHQWSLLYRSRDLYWKQRACPKKYIDRLEMCDWLRCGVTELRVI